MDRIVIDAPRSKGWALLAHHPTEVDMLTANYFHDDERSLPRGRELVHAISLLDASKDEVANVEGGFPNIVIVVVM
jgi:hypothetical protein